jgi:hypothetical protein
MVVERVLVERHPRGRMVIVHATLWVEPLLPPLRLGRLQCLVCNPEQVCILLDVHAEILGVLEHVGHGALEIIPAKVPAVVSPPRRGILWNP